MIKDVLSYNTRIFEVLSPIPAKIPRSHKILKKEAISIPWKYVLNQAGDDRGIPFQSMPKGIYIDMKISYGQKTCHNKKKEKKEAKCFIMKRKKLVHPFILIKETPEERGQVKFHLSP